MKKIYLLMMFALLGMVANAAEVTINFSDIYGTSTISGIDKESKSMDGFTFSFTKGNAPAYNKDLEIRLYGGKSNTIIDGNTMTVSAEAGRVINKIVLTAGSSATWGELTSSIGSVTEDNRNAIWTGEGSTVTFTANRNSADLSKSTQNRYTSITITYEEVAVTQVATPTFSVEESEIYPDTEIAIECITEGATIKYRLDEEATEYVYSEPLTFEIGTTVTITAWAEAEGLEASEQAVVTYTVVEKPASTDFVKVTDLSQLKDGDKVIIACESKNTILAAPEMDGSEPKDFRGYVEFGLSESFTLPGTLDASILTLGLENGKYTFFDGTYYLALTKEDNKLHSVDMINDNAYWTIDINAGETTITSVAYSGRSMKYNSQFPRFACYKDGQESVSIYREPNGSSSVNDAVANEFKAVAVANGIEVNVAEAGLVSVYNAAGQLVANVNVAEGATTINVAGGFYIVKAGNNVAKVLVK
jgi:hypothetical protein